LYFPVRAFSGYAIFWLCQKQGYCIFRYAIFSHPHVCHHLELAPPLGSLPPPLGCLQQDRANQALLGALLLSSHEKEEVKIEYI
jgi:hypothetical protein